MTEPNRKDLKIQALLESLSKDKTKHEDELANLRVELTIVSQERDALVSRVQELETSASEEVTESSE